ncbi:MAG: HTH domain-containing protein [Clostridiales bacterium]|nr:MAG: HTH domain-containing protein [Clostridiales bacterium]
MNGVKALNLFLLRERKTTSAYLADMFNVSRQTIVNDMVFLSCRLPITTKIGGGGGIFLEMDFEAPKEYLSAEEEKFVNYVIGNSY